ncbi:serine--tRNA ligase-like isoform X2 [Camellia sinensis]|uniref:serine--tRNA ligase-like isoform X2 n=1 Tax=Camellia sinensis TaxID=4442 RepID=UPI0010361026|nr:serine--tRNA ligase-like isoform X2 [Camellia sinensis]XP_028060446.1 serine--tRNA ligase-like isoform X2 [Camellia sinensis]
MEVVMACWEIEQSLQSLTGGNVAGGRGFYLKGDGVRLNQALINFGLDFVEKRGYTALQTPFFMRKDIMAKCAQLAQFDEELYKNGLDTKVEKSRKQLKERKNRTKKIRGVKKTKAGDAAKAGKKK